MAGSPFKRLFVQASHYSLASLFTVLAGLVTFPLLTRVFSVADYGLIGFISATLTVAVAIGKVGFQQSIIRYQSEIRADKGPFTMPQLYATALFGVVASGILAAVLLVAGTRVAPPAWLGDVRTRALFAIAAPIIAAQVVESALVGFVRADQMTSLLMKYQVAKRYLSLSIVLFAVFAVSTTLTAFYVGNLLTEVVAVTALLLLFLRRRDWPPLSRRDFSPALYLQLLRFGAPMMIGYELSGIVLSVGDRYVIHGTIGETPLGLYAAAYNLCQYVYAIFLASVGQAIVPLYMQMWEREGQRKTLEFIDHSLRSYVLFGAPIIAGLASLGPELLSLMASEKYASAAPVLSWVIAGMVVDGASAMLGAGLFIQRKPGRIMSVVLTCAGLNIALNLILVRRIGIMGAAIATLVSYVVTSLALALAGRRYLPVKIPFATIGRAGAAALVTYLTLSRLLPGRQLLTVGVRVAAGVAIYGVIIALVDPDARALARKAQARLRGDTDPQAL